MNSLKDQLWHRVSQDAMIRLQATTTPHVRAQVRNVTDGLREEVWGSISDVVFAAWIGTTEEVVTWGSGRPLRSVVTGPSSPTPWVSVR